MPSLDRLEMGLYAKRVFRGDQIDSIAIERNKSA